MGPISWAPQGLSNAGRLPCNFLPDRKEKEKTVMMHIIRLNSLFLQNHSFVESIFPGYSLRGKSQIIIHLFLSLPSQS